MYNHWVRPIVHSNIPCGYRPHRHCVFGGFQSCIRAQPMHPLALIPNNDSRFLASSTTQQSQTAKSQQSHCSRLGDMDGVDHQLADVELSRLEAFKR